ncbi:MAG: rhodanese-like domain-containing protein [Candidatus Limiplasma sp.]|nr:rhodanese-like domain-containing protein [Candidatus Limiplasma sp.]
MMDAGGEYILLDVRTQGEFDAGHIPGAILIPDFELASRAEAELPQKDAVILLYCRSGNRSASSARTLVEMGYTNVYDFGGINSWPYETQTP